VCTDDDECSKGAQEGIAHTLITSHVQAGGARKGLCHAATFAGSFGLMETKPPRVVVSDSVSTSTNPRKRAKPAEGRIKAGFPMSSLFGALFFWDGASAPCR